MGYRPEVSADTLRDIYGSDAIIDVVEKPYEEVHREDQAEERLWILDILKKSAGDTAQAAYRLGMTEDDLKKKIAEYQIDTRKP